MALVLSGSAATEAPRAQQVSAIRRIVWEDTAALRPQLEAAGITATGFPAYVERVHQGNIRRVREGDLDHLIFYLLQSTRFTTLAAIEPALSAKSFVDSLSVEEREAFLRNGEAPLARIPATVRARVTALINAFGSASRDARLVYFRDLVIATVPDAKQRETALLREYVRAMRFVYEKEFVAQRSAQPATAVVELYRSRGLSTDTAIEAGFLVNHGLGVVKSLQPLRRIRRVLIIGPGLDLAPRTALLEAGPPESYQPWAVIDALVSRGLSRLDDLEVMAADINPRVVEHIRRAREKPPVLTLVSGIGDSDTVTLSQEYRDYFARLGQTLGEAAKGDMLKRGADRHLFKIVGVHDPAARALHAATLDIVTERLTGPPFELVVATNILPYFDDVELMCAMSNIAAMLAPGGVFLHNEPRPLLQAISDPVGLPFDQSRHVVIAAVRRAPAPLVDSVFLHRKR